MLELVFSVDKSLLGWVLMVHRAVADCLMKLQIICDEEGNTSHERQRANPGSYDVGVSPTGCR